MKTNKENVSITSSSSHGVISQSAFCKIMNDYHSDIPEKTKAAQEQAVVLMKGLVHSIINRFFSEYMAEYYNELVQEGTIGILKGLPTYDVKESAPTTYFYWRIKHEIQAFVDSGIIGTTEYYSSAIQKIKQAERKLKSLGIQYTYIDIALEANLSAKTVQQIYTVMYYCGKYSVDCTPFCCPEDIFYYESPSAEDIFIKKEDTQNIRNIINNTLSPQEKFIIENLTGINQEQKRWCYEEIALVLGLSTEEVKLIRNRAVKRLRKTKQIHDKKSNS